MAYGATGAGKTHTMIGNAQNKEAGLMFHTVVKLFKNIQEME